jgi:hypothetical protein
MRINMSVQELNRVHRRYIRVSNFFKSGWTFHQFIQGLHKVFSDLEIPQYPADFQSVYGDLKEISQHLSESTTGAVIGQLDQVEKRLAPMVQAMLATDDEISPALLRQFFQRVKNYDDNILSQLVRFYLYAKNGSTWNLDRLDKADFLSTKLAEEYNDERSMFMVRDPTYLREVAQSFWAALGVDAPSEAKIADVYEQIQRHARSIAATASVDALHGQQLVAHYRDFKHQLGDHFFQPKVFQAVLEANLVLKNQVQQLYRHEEQRIIAEYQQIFELERDVPVDVKLGEELAQFRVAVEHFEEQLQGENIRLDDLAKLRHKVRELMPKLQPSPSLAQTGPFVPPREAREHLEATTDGDPLTSTSPDHEYVKEQLSIIVDTLDDTNPTSDPRKVVLTPEVFGLGLSAREIVAYRRLFGGGPSDRELERFVLRSAALRARINEEVEEIKGILDDTAVNRNAPVFQKARVTARHGDLCVRRFAHRIDQAVLDGDISEAKSLQLLRMRMTRVYSGLWLMVHRS